MGLRKKVIDTDGLQQAELIRLILLSLAVSLLVAFLLYQSFVIGMLLWIPIGRWLYHRETKRKVEKRKEQLRDDFGECLISLVAAMSAGYSFENSFAEAYKELSLEMPKDREILVELKAIQNQLSMNETVESALRSFAQRSEVDDIERFAEVVQTAKRSGGNLIAIMKTTEETLSRRREVNREIATMIAAKKMEFRIMMLVPPGILVYLLLASPEFLTPLYHNVGGNLFMTFGMIGYLAAVWLAEKISAITC